MTRPILSLAAGLLTVVMILALPASAQEGKAEGQPAAEAKPEAAQAETPKAEAQPKPSKPDPKPEVKPEAEAKAPAAKPAAPSKPEAKPAEDKPATHTIKPELFKVEVSLKGNFESESMDEITIRPEAWTALKVAKAAAHGATVERGDVLVEFEVDDVDKAIDAQRRKVELAELTLKLAQENLKAMEALTPMSIEAAELSKQYADQDLARFHKIDRPMSEKIAEFDVESSQNYLDYQKEELRQLEKMYKADDLTEETEEIILRRARDMVKRYEFYLEQAKLYRDEMLEVRLPRAEKSIERSTKREGIDLARTKLALSVALNQARLEVESQKVSLGGDKERLDKLVADRQAMTIKAPNAGVVYYGRFKDGDWSGAASIADKLRKGGSVSANEIFMTVVKPRPIAIRAELPEKHLVEIRPGLRGKVQPTALPDVRLDATVASVTPVPVAAGKFEATIRVKLTADGESLMPGMSCSVKFMPYVNRRALTVPASAVSTDELDDQKHYVFLLTDGKQKKRQIQVGRKSGDKIEVLLGLEEGDQVVKEYPKDKK
jgi:multidrug resistance efflux pump